MSLYGTGTSTDSRKDSTTFTNLSGHLILCSTCQRPCLLTEGKNLGKGLGQIYENHVEVLMLFSTLLFYLSGREDHVHGAPSCTKPTLTLRYNAVAVNVPIKLVLQQDTC